MRPSFQGFVFTGLLPGFLPSDVTRLWLTPNPTSASFFLLLLLFFEPFFQVMEDWEGHHLATPFPPLSAFYRVSLGGEAISTTKPRMRSHLPLPPFFFLFSSSLFLFFVFFFTFHHPTRVEIELVVGRSRWRRFQWVQRCQSKGRVLPGFTEFFFLLGCCCCCCFVERLSDEVSPDDQGRPTPGVEIIWTLQRLIDATL